MTLRALIIDDNAGNIEALAALLRREGVTPTAIATPREIGAALDQVDRFDVVFLDLEFPNHSGFDVVAELREDARLKDAPIVAYTVHTSEENEARRAGFDSFLGKPLNVQRFPDQLRRILSGEPVWEI
jgi:CheY-like chemotaxis protein